MFFHKELFMIQKNEFTEFEYQKDWIKNAFVYNKTLCAKVILEEWEKIGYGYSCKKPNLEILQSILDRLQDEDEIFMEHGASLSRDKYEEIIFIHKKVSDRYLETIKKSYS